MPGKFLLVPFSLMCLSVAAAQPASTGQSGFYVGLAQGCVQTTPASQRIEIPMLASTVRYRVDPIVRDIKYRNCIIRGTQVNLWVTTVDVVRDSMNLPRVRLSLRDGSQPVLGEALRQSLNKDVVLLRNGRSVTTILASPGLPEGPGIAFGGFGGIREAEATRMSIIKGR